MGSPIHQLLPYVQFCASTVIQEALARTLARADEPYEGHPSYYQYLNAKYRQKRDLLGRALTEAGFAIPNHDATPGGGFFIFARITPAVLEALPAAKQGGIHHPAAPGGVGERTGPSASGWRKSGACCASHRVPSSRGSGRWQGRRTSSSAWRSARRTRPSRRQRQLCGI